MKKITKPIDIMPINEKNSVKLNALTESLSNLSIIDEHCSDTKSAAAAEEHVHFTDGQSLDDKEDSFCSSDNDNNVQSSVPSEYNEDEHLFHFNFLNNIVKNLPEPPKKYKNGTRKSLSFSNEQMREIERSNKILLQKILSKGPTFTPSRKRSGSLMNYYEDLPRASSAAVNRKKHQRQIDLHNQILKKKIENISRRKSVT